MSVWSVSKYKWLKFLLQQYLLQENKTNKTNYWMKNGTERKAGFKLHSVTYKYIVFCV